MRRRLFNFAAAVSLVLLVGIVALWVRSYFISDALGISDRMCLTVERGELLIIKIEPDMNFFVDRGYHSEAVSDPDESWNVRRVAQRPWNVIAAHAEVFPGLRATVVRLWLGVLLMSVAPSMMFARIMRTRRRRAAGLCSACGYDLRASPGRCPECGTAKAEASSTMIPSDPTR